MSLTAILKKIEKVDQKHREIIQRYNSASRECPHQFELEKEEQEDQRIFGYSGSQILGVFKHDQKDYLEKTRPCTAAPISVCTFDKAKRQSRKSANQRRAYSISKPALRYKEQYNFLFKEDIFDQNYEKNRLSTPFQGVHIKKIEQRLAKNLKRQGVPFSVKEQQKMLIQRERQQFIDDFEDNLQLMKNRENYSKTMAVRSKMTYERTSNKSRKQIKDKENIEDLFRLTKASFNLGSKKIKLSFTSSEQNLKEINKFMNQYEDSKFIAIDTGNKDPLPFESFEEELLNCLPQKFILTCISVTSLESIRFNMQVVNDQIVISETKERVNLRSLRDQLLVEGFVHMCFHSNQKLLYELFILNKNFVYNKNIEYQIAILSYHLKRFLLFDEATPIKAARQNAELMLKNNVDIPDDFFEFVGTISKKMVHFYDKDRRYFTLCLKSILTKGLRGVQAFKREVGFGDKVIKLKEGTRKEFKKYLYNWAYFYICSSLSAKISVFVVVIHFFSFVVLDLLKSFLILFNLLPSQLSHELPRNFALVSSISVSVQFRLLKSFFTIAFSFFFGLDLFHNPFSFLLPLSDFLKIYTILIINKVSQSYPNITIIGMLYYFWVCFFLNLFFSSVLPHSQFLL